MIIRLLASALLVSISMQSNSFATPPPTVPHQVAEDLVRAQDLIGELRAILPSNLPWQEWSRSEIACLSSLGSIRGYKAEHSMRIRAEDVGRTLDVEAIFSAAREWLQQDGFEFVLDTVHDSGKWDIRAVKKTKEIGVSVGGYDEIIGVTAITKCRDI